jgi:hypothetical protein
LEGRKVYVIEKIENGEAELDSGDIVKLNNLQIVNELSSDVINDEVEKADKADVIKRRLAREGLE